MNFIKILTVGTAGKSRSAPRSNPLPFYRTFLAEKGALFVYLLLTNGTLSHTLFRTLHPFYGCKCTFFYIGISPKNRTLSRLYKATKFICYPFWALSKT